MSNYMLRKLTKQETKKLDMIKTMYNLTTKEDAVKFLIKEYPIKIVDSYCKDC